MEQSDLVLEAIAKQNTCLVHRVELLLLSKMSLIADVPLSFLQLFRCHCFLHITSIPLFFRESWLVFYFSQRHRK